MFSSHRVALLCLLCAAALFSLQAQAQPDSVATCSFPYDTVLTGYYNDGLIYGSYYIPRLGFTLILGQGSYPLVCPLTLNADFGTGDTMSPTPLLRLPSDSPALFSGEVCCGIPECSTFIELTYQGYQYVIEVSGSKKDRIYMHVVDAPSLDTLYIRFTSEPVAARLSKHGTAARAATQLLRAEAFTLNGRSLSALGRGTCFPTSGVYFAARPPGRPSGVALPGVASALLPPR